MMLRNRGRSTNGDAESPSSARQAARGTPRTRAATPSSGTPSGRKQIKAASPTKSARVPASYPGEEQVSGPLSETTAPNEAIREADTVKLSEEVDYQENDRTGVAEALLPLMPRTDPVLNIKAQAAAMPTPHPLKTPAYQLGMQGRTPSPLDPQPKVILRIPRPSPPPSTTPEASAPSHQLSYHSAYPLLPSVQPDGGESGRLTYREGSATSKSTDVGSGPDTEYTSALSGVSDVERSERKLSAGTSGSDGPMMPGGLRHYVLQGREA